MENDLTPSRSGQEVMGGTYGKCGRGLPAAWRMLKPSDSAWFVTSENITSGELSVRPRPLRVAKL